LQLGADAENWKQFTLYDTRGKVLIHITSRVGCMIRSG
jgi:hypothetical protein